MKKDQTVAILHRLHTDRQAAKKFVSDPAAEWKALGGEFPAGVTPAQFSQRVRSGPLFKKIEATANGQMGASFTWSPCVTGLVFFLDALGITGVAAAAALSGPIALFLAADATWVAATLAGLGQGSIIVIATALCHGA